MKKNSKMTVEKKQTTAKREAKLKNRNVCVLLQRLDQASSTAVTEVAEPATKPAFCIGIDLGDKKSRYCFMNWPGKYVAEGSLSTTADEFRAYFSQVPRSRIALEVGTHSPWVSALLEELGHEVYVANPRKMEAIHKNKRKNDRIDARILARYARADVELLHPIRHRGVEARQDLVVLRARDALVSARTQLVNSARKTRKPGKPGTLPGFE